MFMSRNFTTIKPGRYEDASKRVVEIRDQPEQVKRRRPDLSEETINKWTGVRMRADGHTPEGNYHYDDEGSEFQSRATSSPNDLARAIEYFDSPAAA